MAKNRGTNPQSDTAKAAGRRWRWLLLTLVLTGFAAWLLEVRLRQSGFQWRVLAANLLHLNWLWAVAATALALLTYWGRALRWAVMLRPLRPEVRTGSLVRATAIGFTAVVLLGRPGEFVRPYLIAVRERVPLSSQLAAWFLERILDLLAILLIFGISLTQLQGTRAQLGPGLRWVLEVGGYVLGAIGALCLIILVMLSRFSETMHRRITAALRFLPDRHHRRMERLVGTFLEGTAAVKDARSALWLLFFTILEWAIIVLSFVALVRAFPATAGFGLRDVLVLMGFIAFGSVLQIPGVGGGVQIVTILVLTELYRFPLELATGIAIILWAITFVAIVPVGLALGFHEGLNWRRLRDLEREAAANAEELSHL